MRQKKYVYKFTFPNGKVYIGSTGDPDVRWQYNGTLYGKMAVGKAIKTFGWENVKREIVFESDNSDEVESEEKRLIAEYKDNCYNHADNPNWQIEYSQRPYGCKNGYVHVWTIKGETKPALDWCRIYGKDLSNTLMKIKNFNMTPLEALTAPKVPRGMYARRYWNSVGFKCGADKTSYVTPEEEWPEEIKKAEDLDETQDSLTLGAAIKAILKREGLSQYDLADRTGKSTGTLQRAIRTNNTTIDSLIEFANAAGYAVALVKENESPITIINPAKIETQ